jgi:putative MATE family efflux protein
VVRFPNPVRLIVLYVGLGLARVGLIDETRAQRTTDLAWPRVVTGLARMSKNAADAAMVGIGVGPAAIAGVGFAGPYWGLTFSLGAGIAAGTIALVSQSYGAGAFGRMSQAIRSSVLVVVVVTVPLAVLYLAIPRQLIDLLSSDPVAIGYGTEYLRLVALGVPFAALNLIGSRALIGTDDAWTPMVLRAGGGASNIVLNAVFIFGLDMGVSGAALATVLANVGVTAAFAVGIARGRLPLIGTLPVEVSAIGTYADRGTIRDVVEIGLPVIGRNSVWTTARFPMFAVLDLFGSTVVAAYVISRRIWGLMNTPGWGFGLAASSLVGQELGGGDERAAESYGREIVRFSLATYVVFAGLTAALARPIVLAFVGDPADPSVPIAVGLVYAACIAVLAQGVNSTISGALDASGDTRWPFYSRALGMFGGSIPLAYLGATTPLGVWGLYLAFFAETFVPAAINYYRFTTGKWKAISREYRPETPVSDD